MKIFYLLSIVLIFIPFCANASSHFPNISGEVYLESKTGFVNSESVSGTYKDSSLLTVEPKFSLNVNDRWSIKTSLEIAPVQSRNTAYYEIGEVFISNEYPNDLGEYGIVIEELKGDFRNEDMNFFFGKYNPAFGSAWDADKKLGLFTSDFTQDYELREKLGLGVAALLDDDGAISVNAFFNDTTGLSNSALKKRGKNRSGNNTAGNNTNLSSYSITFSGNNFFDIEDLRYNFGYRDLDVENEMGYDNEKAFVAGLEYTIPLNYKTYFIPFIEIMQANNFNGVDGQDILYTTAALRLKYSNWNLGVSSVMRDIERKGSEDYTDKQLQYFVGYKFQNGIDLDVSYMDVEQSNNEAKVVGISASYLYNFSDIY